MRPAKDGEPYSAILDDVFLSSAMACGTLREKLQNNLASGGKTDLPNEKPAGTWYWKLYEITLKVVVDAVMERFWPKPK